MKKRNGKKLVLFIFAFYGCVNAAQPMMGGWDPVRDQQPSVTRELLTYDDLAVEVQERASKLFDEQFVSEEGEKFTPSIKAVVDRFPYFSFANAFVPALQFSLEDYLESKPEEHKIILRAYPKIN